MALAGFYSGLVFAILVPTVFAGLLTLLFNSDSLRTLYPFVLLTLVIPLGLLVSTRTRRFGAYMWLGLLSTLLVVVGVAAVVLTIMVGTS